MIHQRLEQILGPRLPTILVVRDGGQEGSTGFSVRHVVVGMVADVYGYFGDEGREDGYSSVLLFGTVYQVYYLCQALV